MIPLKEAFLKIKNECKIPLRTVQHYVHLGLLPHPEMEGRAGSYDLEETKIIERAKIIQLLKSEFGLSLNEILKFLRLHKNEQLPLFLGQLERIKDKFPLRKTQKFYITENNEQSREIYSDRSAVARRWFLNIVDEKGALSEVEYKKQVDDWIAKCVEDPDIVKAFLTKYCMDVKK